MSSSKKVHSVFYSSLLTLDFLLKAKHLKILEQSFRNSWVFSMVRRMRRNMFDGWSFWADVNLMRTPVATNLGERPA